MGLYYIAILLVSGLVFSRILEKFSFPEVTGYLIGGILIGPSVIGLLSTEGLESISIINKVALGFIAFSIGSEMKLRTIRKLGSKIFTITFFESFGAFAIVFTGIMLLFDFGLPFSLTLASIACATAPAATLLVIREYKAKGELVDILIPVVALDDAFCIIAFGIASSIAGAILSGLSVNIHSVLLTPLFEIFGSIALGLVAGFTYNFISKFMRSNGELTCLVVSTVFVLSFVAEHFHLSDLLTLMATSIVITNFGTTPSRTIDILDRMTPPIFVCFFVLSGADLNLASLKSVGLVGIFYITARVIGKYLGAGLSTKFLGFSSDIQKYLGLTLVPQAGVAIGLSQIASVSFPAPYGGMIRTVILGATIIYELIGPLSAKFALSRTGCIKNIKKVSNSEVNAAEM